MNCSYNRCNLTRLLYVYNFGIQELCRQILYLLNFGAKLSELNKLISHYLIKYIIESPINIFILKYIYVN